jgi:hypothetical protein
MCSLWIHRSEVCKAFFFIQELKFLTMTCYLMISATSSSKKIMIVVKPV